MRRVLGIAAAVMVALASAGASAADWPHLRGPHYTGISDENGLADSWPAEGPTALWRAELGEGFSSFAAVDGRLYTEDQTQSAQFIVCLDAETGRTLWRRRIDWPWRLESDLPGPRATPTVADGRVYYASAYGIVGCLDARTGAQKWSVDLMKRFGAECPGFGYACSPLVTDGKVFLPVGGRGASVVALDAKDGATVWASGDEPVSYASALPVTLGGRRMIVVPLRNVLAAFDPDTGRELWQRRWSTGYDEHVAFPLYDEPYLLAPLSFRLGATCFRLAAAGDGVSLERAWESRELSNDLVSSLVSRGHVYGFDLHDIQPTGERPARGAMKCIDLATGAVRWTAPRSGMAMPIAADGKLVMLTETGELILARETPERYEELGRGKAFEGAFCWTAPAIHRQRLFVRARTQAACLWLGAPGGAKPVATVQAMRRPARDDSIWRGPSLIAPMMEDLSRWYVYSLAAVALAGLVALAARVVSRSPAWTEAALLGTLFAAGLAGTFLFSRTAGIFVFTWPVALFAAYRLTLRATLRDIASGGRFAASAATALFFAVCVAYFLLCRSLFVPAGIGFLVGFLAAAVPDAFVLRRTWRPAAAILYSAASFTIYYWASGLFTHWRTRL